MEAERVLMAMKGPWRIVHFVVICTYTRFLAAWAMFGNTFIGAETSHYCRIPDGFNLTNSVPYDEDGEPEKCLAYKNFSSSTNETEECPNGWQYGSEMHTIVDSWDLVCDKDHMVDTAQTILILGVMIGAFVTTIFADMYGRKIVLVVSIVAVATSGCITAVIDNYYAYVTLRFITGIFQQGIILASYVLCCEMFQTSRRAIAGGLILAFWALGMCCLAVLAYLIPHWRNLLWTVSVPGFLAIPLYWVWPESPSWLMAKKRYGDVSALVKLCKKRNRKYEEKEVLQKIVEELDAEEKKKDILAETSTGNQYPEVGGTDKAVSEEDDKTTHYSLFDIFKSKRLMIYSLINLFIWCTTTLVYYGLSFTSGDLTNDIYSGFFLTGAIEIPAHLAATAALHFIGRRIPTFSFYLIAGVGVLVSMAIPETTESGTDLQPLIITFSMIGKFGISATFGTVFLWSPELYPTTLRNVGIGIASFGGRIGNICAPLSSYMARENPIVIGAIFGLMCVISAGLTFLLPETSGRSLPLSIAEVEGWSRNVSKEEKEAFKQKQLDDKNKLKAMQNKSKEEDFNTRF